ncbi:MAG: hypothetical protein IPJ65_03745 [Archangiaceae bacterium]|nr:hypothetical protein [Archangiaceae bacterium]
MSSAASCSAASAPLGGRALPSGSSSRSTATPSASGSSGATSRKGRRRPVEISCISNSSVAPP